MSASSIDPAIVSPLPNNCPEQCKIILIMAQLEAKVAEIDVELAFEVPNMTHLLLGWKFYLFCAKA